MKKLMMFVFLLILSIPLVAQVIEPPTDWLGLFANINTWLYSLLGIAAVTVFLAAEANKLLKTEGFLKQLVAWAIAIILLFVGNLVNIGFMAELSWLNTLIYGIAAGFLANGIFDITLIRALLRWLKVEPPER